MKQIFLNLKAKIVAHKIISAVLLIVLIFGGYYIHKKMTSSAGITRYITSKVEKGNVISSVSGTGQVSALNQIEIKSKVSGDIVYIKGQNGDVVKSGTTIVQIDARDAQKTVRDRELDVQSAQISLQKLKAEKSSENMNEDLAKAYEDGFTAVSDTFLDLPQTVQGLEDILAQKDLSDNAASAASKTALSYRTAAVNSYYGAEKAFTKNRANYRLLSSSSPTADMDAIIDETYNTTKLLNDALKNTLSFVDFMLEDENPGSDITTAKNTLSTYTSTISSHQSKLSTAQTTIKDTKDSFDDSDLDLQSSELSLTQKVNALADAKEKLVDYYVRAPFNGTISALTLKKGDTVSSGTAIATILTAQQNAELSMNEVDVAKVKLGQKSTLTFDAIPDLTLTGSVSEIDSVGTVSQGVVTYTVKVTFDAQDARVKPGMSVTASIISDQKNDVVVVPNSAVKSQNGKSYVEMLDASGKPTRVPVEVGLVSDTETEIVSGLDVGEQIITRTITTSTTTGATATPSLFGGGAATRATGTTTARPAGGFGR